MPMMHRAGGDSFACERWESATQTRCLGGYVICKPKQHYSESVAGDEPKIDVPPERVDNLAVFATRRQSMVKRGRICMR